MGGGDVSVFSEVIASKGRRPSADPVRDGGWYGRNEADVELRTRGANHTGPFLGCVATRSVRISPVRSQNCFAILPATQNAERSHEAGKKGFNHGRFAGASLPDSTPSVRFAALTNVFMRQECEGRDLNPRTPTGAGLKPATFGQAQPPSRVLPYSGDRKVGFGRAIASTHNRYIMFTVVLFVHG